MTRAIEHALRVKAVHYGPNPFCACCGQLRERHGAGLCRECATWANRYALRISRLRYRASLRAAFALIDGGRIIR